MSPKIFDFRETAEHTDLNDLIGDIPRDVILHGSQSNSDLEVTKSKRTTVGSQQGTPDFVIPVNVITGNLLNFAYRVDPDASSSGSIIIKLKIGATVDSLFIDTKASDTTRMESVDITALSNNGDVRGEAADLEFYLWAPAGTGANFYFYWIRSSMFSANADNWFF
jgi:hypothetical protein